MLLALAGPALAHDFAILTLGPGPEWCSELNEQAGPADVVVLLPGTYPGGCEILVGGLPDLNEALLVYPLITGTVVIGADDDGLSVRIRGEPTRLLLLTLEGRVEVAAENATLDTSVIGSVEVDPDIDRITVLFNDLPDLALDVESTVVRGNRLDDLSVTGTTGLVADNTIRGSAFSTLPFHRNLVVGDLEVRADAFANVVVGETTASGALFGNTLLGSVSVGSAGGFDARNNLTVRADLDGAAGNLRCDDCFEGSGPLDVRPVGAALEAVPVEAPGPADDFCSATPVSIGAVSPLEALEGLPWTAFDRTRALGCVAGADFHYEVVSLGAPPPPPRPDPPFVETAPVVPQRGCAVAQGSRVAAGAQASALRLLSRRTSR